MGDGLDEVGLAEARVGVDEDRVVGGGRRLGDALRHGRRVLVVRAGDEAVEHVARVEVAGGLRGPGGAAPARARAGPGRRAAGAAAPRAAAGAPPRHCWRQSRRRARRRRRGRRPGRRGLSPSASATWPGEALLDPLAGEIVGHTDDEGAVVEAERQRAVEPELEGGFVEAAAKVLLRLVPDECQLVVRVRPVVRDPRGCGGPPGMVEIVSQRMLSRRCRPSSRKARLPSPSECINPMSSSTTSSRKAVAEEMPSSLAMAVGPGRAELHEQHEDLRLARGELDLRRGGVVAGSGAWAGILIVNTAPPPRLSSTVSTPRRNWSDSRARGRPEPTPRMIWRCSARRGREARLEGALLVVHAGPVVGDADGLAVVEDGDDDVAKAGVQEVLDELLDRRCTGPGRPARGSSDTSSPPGRR